MCGDTGNEGGHARKVWPPSGAAWFRKFRLWGGAGIQSRPHQAKKGRALNTGEEIARFQESKCLLVASVLVASGWLTASPAEEVQVWVEDPAGAEGRRSLGRPGSRSAEEKGGKAILGGINSTARTVRNRHRKESRTQEWPLHYHSTMRTLQKQLCSGVLDLQYKTPNDPSVHGPKIA